MHFDFLFIAGFSLGIYNMSLHLKDFEENLVASFTKSRKDKDFTDVTLVCEDGFQIEAHRVILVASSPFFETLLKISNHAHPLVYMRGIKSSELIPLVDFLYKGEATVGPDHLDTFLGLAEELQLKGLTRRSEPKTDLKRKLVPKLNSNPLSLLDQEKREEETDRQKILPASNGVELLSESVEEKIRSMMTVRQFFLAAL